MYYVGRQRVVENRGSTVFVYATHVTDCSVLNCWLHQRVKHPADDAAGRRREREVIP